MAFLFKKGSVHFNRSLSLICRSWRNYTSVSNLQVSKDKKTVSVEFDGKERHVYHAVWLKHLCHCPKCRDPSSGQTQHPPELLRGSYKLSNVEKKGDNLRVSWEDDDDPNHRGTFPIDWLKANVYGEDVLKKLSREARPVPLTGKVSEFEYKSVMESESTRLDWLLKIYEDGLSLLRNVPLESEKVEEIADFIYACSSTMYGRHINITTDYSKEGGADVAYQQGPLSYHTDEPFYESAPGLTLLHCLKFDECVEGGHTVMIDSFAAAEEFRKDFPEKFDVLTKTPIILGRICANVNGRPVHVVYHRPHIILGYNGEIISSRWTNAVHIGICATHDMVEPYYHARWQWYNFLQNFKVHHVIRFTPGDLLTMNNARILHSRTDFTLNGGERLLQYSTVNIDEFKSEVLAQCTHQGRPLPKTRVGNRDYIC